jgi:hypothetical protein
MDPRTAIELAGGGVGAVALLCLNVVWKRLQLLADKLEKAYEDRIAAEQAHRESIIELLNEKSEHDEKLKETLNSLTRAIEGVAGRV